ncbi:uncharacterized protein LOC144579995 [Callithrix jacchus]
MFASDRMAFFVCVLKTCSALREDFEGNVGGYEAGARGRATYPVLAGAKAHEVRVSQGKSLEGPVHSKPRKGPNLACSFVPGHKGPWVREQSSKMMDTAGHPGFLLHSRSLLPVSTVVTSRGPPCHPTPPLTTWPNRLNS